MKKANYCVVLLLVLVFSCKQDSDRLMQPGKNTVNQPEELDRNIEGHALDGPNLLHNVVQGPDTPPPIVPPVDPPPTNPLDGFTEYNILKGAHYSLQSSPVSGAGDSLVFDVYFDSTAIYELDSAHNQADVNKLYGFSDCNTLHQMNSARFGWRYYKGQLELFAYCYANSVRTFVSLGVIKTHTFYTCTIVSKPGKYLFYLGNNTPLEMTRGCSTGGVRYQLYPYFGGDEVAPHDINVWIKVKN